MKITFKMYKMKKKHSNNDIHFFFSNKFNHLAKSGTNYRSITEKWWKEATVYQIYLDHLRILMGMA
jgi:hypothetical protein